MKKENFRINKKHIPLILILFLGLIMRLNRYGFFPPLGEAKDELTWTWAGANWIRGYGFKTFVVRPDSQGKLEPVNFWMDNPPLFSLIPGASAILAGQKEFLLPSVESIRWPMIILGVINIYLLYLVGNKWFGRGVGILSSLFYSTIPTMVFASRLAVAENLIIFWMLLVLWLINPSDRIQTEKKWLVLGVVTGLTLLTKLSAVAILLAMVIWFVREGMSSKVWRLSLIALGIASLYPLMGLNLGWGNFWEAFSQQSLHQVGWDTIVKSILNPLIISEWFADGWIVLGWLGLVWQLGTFDKKQESQFLNLIIVSWLVIIMLTVDNAVTSALYRYPLFPLMCLALARWTEKIYKSRNFWALIPVGILGMLPNLSLLLKFQKVSVGNTLVRLGLLGFLIPMAILMIKPKYKLGKKVIFFLMLILSVTVNIFVILNVSELILEAEAL